jgi:hypothetical protein
MQTPNATAILTGSTLVLETATATATAALKRDSFGDYVEITVSRRVPVSTVMLENNPGGGYRFVTHAVERSRVVFDVAMPRSIGKYLEYVSETEGGAWVVQQS